MKNRLIQKIQQIQQRQKQLQPKVTKLLKKHKQ